MESSVRLSARSLHPRDLATRSAPLSAEEVGLYAHRLGAELHNLEGRIKRLSDSAAAVQTVAALDKGTGQYAAAGALSSAFAANSLGFTGALERLKTKIASLKTSDKSTEPTAWAELFDEFHKARTAFQNAVSRSADNLNKVSATTLPSPPATKAEDEAESVPAPAASSRGKKAGKGKGKGKRGLAPASAVSSEQFEEAKRGKRFLAEKSAHQRRQAFVAKRFEFVPAPEASKTLMDQKLEQLKGALLQAAKSFVGSESGRAYLSARFAMLGGSTKIPSEEVNRLLAIPQVLASVPADEFCSLDRMLDLAEADPARVRFEVLTRRLVLARPSWDVRVTNRVCEIAARFLDLKPSETEADAEVEVVESWESTVDSIVSTVEGLLLALARALGNALIQGLRALGKRQARAKKAAGAAPSGEVSAADKAHRQEEAAVERVKPLFRRAGYHNAGQAFVDFLSYRESAGATANGGRAEAVPMSADAFLAFLKGREEAKVGGGVAAVSSDGLVSRE